MWRLFLLFVTWKIFSLPILCFVGGEGVYKMCQLIVGVHPWNSHVLGQSNTVGNVVSSKSVGQSREWRNNRRETHASKLPSVQATLTQKNTSILVERSEGGGGKVSWCGGVSQQAMLWGGKKQKSRAKKCLLFTAFMSTQLEDLCGLLARKQVSTMFADTLHQRDTRGFARRVCSWGTEF